MTWELLNPTLPLIGKIIVKVSIIEIANAYFTIKNIFNCFKSFFKSGCNKPKITNIAKDVQRIIGLISWNHNCCKINIANINGKQSNIAFFKKLLYYYFLYFYILK